MMFLSLEYQRGGEHHGGNDESSRSEENDAARMIAGQHGTADVAWLRFAAGGFIRRRNALGSGAGRGFAGGLRR